MITARHTDLPAYNTICHRLNSSTDYLIVETLFRKRHWVLQVGADLFGGDSIGLFGRFDNSDRVYSNVRYTF